MDNINGSIPYINLYDCFDYYQEKELIKMYCKVCKDYYDSYFSKILYLLPEILVINLDRGMSVYVCNFNFPEELDLTNYVINKEFYTKYKLYGIICHIGPNSIGGHFIAYCRNRMDDKWYLYNDSNVTLCEKPKQYLKENAYILFYKSKIINNIQNNKNMNNNINNNVNINMNNINNNNINNISSNNFNRNIIFQEYLEIINKKNTNKNIINDYSLINQKQCFGNNNNNDEERNQLHQVGSNEDEDIISVIFSTLDQRIHYSLPCKKTDSFNKIEQKLYKEFPEYKEKNKYFLANGKQIDPNSTLEENNIKNSDTIMLNILEDIQ